jgi:hypothetical protein
MRVPWRRVRQERGGRLASVGIAMPADFNLSGYDAVNVCMASYKSTHPAQWGSFAAAWNAVAYRYCGLAEADKELRTSITSSNAPPPEERYRQEQALFSFFANGVSTLECFFFACYCFASVVNHVAFPVTEAKGLRIDSHGVAKKFGEGFQSEQLTREMARCLKDEKYREMADFRIVLFHRGSLPRRFYRGGQRDGAATIPAKPTQPSDQWLFDLPLDEQTIRSWREWLSEMLSGLIDGAEHFCARNVRAASSTAS